LIQFIVPVKKVSNFSLRVFHLFACYLLESYSPFFSTSDLLTDSTLHDQVSDCTFEFCKPLF